VAMAPSKTASVGAPLELPVLATDDLKYTNGTSAPLSSTRPPVTVRWSKYRGPGAVTLEKPRPEVTQLSQAQGPFSGEAKTTATFIEPGAYILQVPSDE